MNVYPLKDILRIRVIRENKAAENLVKAKLELEKAIKKVKQKQKELENYRIWRVKEEERMFNDIIKKKLKKEDLDELKFEIGKLRQKELDHEKAVEDAKKEKEQAAREVEEARTLYQGAVVEHEKIKEHKNNWLEEWKRMEENILEKEIEELRSKTMVIE